MNLMIVWNVREILIMQFKMGLVTRIVLINVWTNVHWLQEYVINAQMSIEIKMIITVAAKKAFSRNKIIQQKYVGIVSVMISIVLNVILMIV